MRFSLVSYIEQHIEEEHDGLGPVEITIMYEEEEPTIRYCPVCGAKCDVEP